MYRLRKEQTQAFESAKLPAFEDYMVEHLRGFATRHCQVLGEPSVREIIRSGVEQAGSYGLTTRGPVRLYIELMFILGSGFHTDPQLPWANRLLADPNIGNEAERADRLYETSLDYHTNVIGPDSEYATRALRGIHREASAVFGLTGEQFVDEILEFMKRIYPEKYNSAGEAILRSLVLRSRQLAESLLATTEGATALFVTSMFAFGHTFHSDPLYPWISGTLNNAKSIKGPDARVDRLFEKTRMYMEHMVEYFDQSHSSSVQ